MDIKILSYEDRDAGMFKALNLEWLEGYGLLEPADLPYLDHPRQQIIEKGGAILMAVMNNSAVGTCALLRESRQRAELAKLAVSSACQGMGIGRMLAEASISIAREMGIGQLYLISNKKLRAALGLYESLGFQHAPLPADLIYETADVYMETEL